eukprot:TRINITY_DN12181_c0_g1_i10.p1 TRINITY_DN12181_c0_g1~~TRINITY_DN12181_c0_g1_i10.p1  ORF type:complete len:1253 (-),score=72.06 TRINITY_DN12181_c0_g1_i10:402-4160(-)
MLSTSDLQLSEQQMYQQFELRFGIQIKKAKQNGYKPIHLAAQLGQQDVVKYYLSKDVNLVNQTTNSGATPLCIASYYGQANIIQTLLDAPGIDVNRSKHTGSTPLYIASMNGHKDIVKILTSSPKVDVNHACGLGVTPLFIAACKGYVDIVKVLISVPGIDVNKSKSDGLNPLLVASQNGHIDVVQVLLQTSNISVYQTRKDGATALYLAALKGHFKIVSLLLTNPKINVNYACSDGETPLYVACSKRHVQVVKELLSVPSIDVNFACVGCYTPLYVACQSGHIDIVQQLLSVPNIDVNKGQQGNYYNNDIVNNIYTQPNILKNVSKQKDLDFDQGNRQYANRLKSVSTLANICEQNNTNVNQVLPKETKDAILSNNMNHYENLGEHNIPNGGILGDSYDYVNNNDENNKSCFHQNNPASFQQDVEYFNRRLQNQDTPLRVASKMGYVDIVKALLSTPGIDVNAQGPDHRTPLFLAARSGHVEVVQYLLSAPSIDVYEERSKSIRALNKASQCGHLDVVKVFLAKQNLIINNNIVITLCEYSLYQKYKSSHEYRVNGRRQQTQDLHRQNSITDLFLQHEVEIKSYDIQGNEHFVRPKISTYCQMLKLFLSDHRVDVNFVSKSPSTAFGKTILLAACAYGHAKFVEIILNQKGVDINVQILQDEQSLPLSVLHAVVFSKIERLEKFQLLFNQVDLDLSSKGRHRIWINGDMYVVEANALVFAVLTRILQDDTTILSEMFIAMNNYSMFTMDVEILWENDKMSPFVSVLDLTVQMKKFALTQELFCGISKRKINKNQLKYYIKVLPEMSSDDGFQNTIEYYVQNERSILEQFVREKDQYISIDIDITLRQFTSKLVHQSQQYQVFSSLVVKSIIDKFWVSQNTSYYFAFQLVLILLLLLTNSIQVTLHFLWQRDNFIHDTQSQYPSTIYCFQTVSLGLALIKLIVELLSYKFNNITKKGISQTKYSKTWIYSKLLTCQMLANSLDWVIICFAICLWTYQQIHSMNNVSLQVLQFVCLFFRGLLLLLPQQQIGYYVIMILLIFWAVWPYLVFLLLFIVVFNMSFALLLNGQQSFSMLFFPTLFSMFGGLETIDMLDEQSSPKKEIGQILAIVFTFIIPIVALNLLIALLTSTYEELELQQLALYVRNKAVLTIEAYTFNENLRYLRKFFNCYKVDKQSQYDNKISHVQIFLPPKQAEQIIEDYQRAEIENDIKEVRRKLEFTKKEMEEKFGQVDDKFNLLLKELKIIRREIQQQQ